MLWWRKQRRYISSTGKGYHLTLPSSIYNVQKKSRFFFHQPPYGLIHMSLTPSPPCERPHKIYITLLKQLELCCSPKLKYNFNTIVTYLKLSYLLFILMIYIHRKSPLFIPSPKKFWYKKRDLCMRRRSEDVSGLLIVLWGCPHGADPQIDMGPPEPDPSSSVWMS